MVVLWYSYDFPIFLWVFLWFSHGFRMRIVPTWGKRSAGTEVSSEALAVLAKAAMARDRCRKLGKAWRNLYGWYKVMPPQ